jgi:hypothetical protein
MWWIALAACTKNDPDPSTTTPDPEPFGTIDHEGDTFEVWGGVAWLTDVFSDEDYVKVLLTTWPDLAGCDGGATHLAWASLDEHVGEVFFEFDALGNGWIYEVVTGRETMGTAWDGYGDAFQVLTVDAQLPDPPLSGDEVEGSVTIDVGGRRGTKGEVAFTVPLCAE